MNKQLTIKPGEIIVVKLGGSIFDNKDTTIEDVVSLQKQDKPLVLVHGGANIVTKWLNQNNAKTDFFQGERITDRAALEMVTAVLGGLVNKEIVAAINTGGGRAVGISGVDGSLIQGRIRDKNMGYVGNVVKVDQSLLTVLLESGFVPVIAPVSLHAFDRPEASPLLLNINGDTIAAEIAAAIGADKLILLTDVNGIHDESSRLLPCLSPTEAEALLASGVASGGMIPKVKACLRAVSSTATTCVIIDGRRKHALLDEVTAGGSGTTIKNTG
ncbi:MAG: acetylglutamate kinase [Dehalococcoidales bacterium]|nr:acetylglutamate kinase [Dehalococcoidales bacterium]